MIVIVLVAAFVLIGWEQYLNYKLDMEALKKDTKNEHN